MKCLSPIKVDGNIFNCGRCHNCRINYTSMWTLRLLYELDNWSEASFVTLTYNDNNLPANYGLCPEHLTKFFKRLRKNLSTEFGSSKKIKYYACGEYGDKTKRPHYHAIIFGLDNYSDKDREILKQSWTYCEPWFFDKNRGRNSCMLPVCREDIQYVTGYVQKKLNGDMADKEYASKGIIPPFSRVSQRMGLDFALKNKDRLINNGFTFINGKRISIPRYFCDKFGVKKSELLTINDNMDLTRIEQSNQILYKQFIRDMQLAGTWYPENLTMMSIRFERWYNGHQWTFAKQIEKDFLQRQKMKGKL